jgi:RNA polymerase-binding transcription factor DksA
MTEVVERMHGELSDLLNLIRRMGGGVVFEEFPGACEENAEAPDTSSAATQRGLIDEANRLAEALERLRGGEHGTCEECGNPITPARLRATPEVTTCLRCQGRLEHSARRLQAGY